MKLRTLVIALGAAVLASVPSAVVAEAANDMELDLLENSDVSDTQGRRELFSFWGFLFMFIHGPHEECPKCLSEAELGECKQGIHDYCPHDPIRHHECALQYVAENWSCDETTETTGTGRSDESSAEAAEYVSYEGGGASTSEAGVADVSRSFSWLMLAIAAAAAAAALIAAAIGQRRERKDRHPMTGAIKRRVDQFSCFADSAVCASTDRPERVVEMTMSQDDMAYELQNDNKAMV